MRKIKYFLVSLIIIFCGSMKVLAQTNIVLETNKKDLKAGDEIKVTAKLNSDTKLYALLATLSYDENVFEAIEETDFKTSEEWSDVIYNPNNKKFGLINKSGEILNNFLNVTLKVKKEATVGNTTITLNNISASDGKKKYYFSAKKAEVLITKDATSNDVIPNQLENIGNEKESIIASFSTKPFLATCLICAILIVLISLILKLLKINIPHYIKIVLTIALIIFIGLSLGLFIFNNNRKDVNNDGNKDYDDAKEIIKYLIDIKGTEEPKSEEIADNNGENEPNKNEANNDNSSDNNSSHVPTKPSKPNKKPDVNNDGSVDIGDVADSVEDANKRNYTVILSDRQKNQVYLNKGQVTLEFDAVIKPYEELKSVEINGEIYPVNKSDGYYYVVIDNINNPGVYEFNFTKAILANGRAIKTNLVIKKEILKSIPYVDLFMVDDKTNTLSFKLEDIDNAFKEGYIIVSDSSEQVVIRENIAQDNKFTYEFLPNETYNIKVYATYELDSNKLYGVVDEANLYVDELIYEHTFSLAQNYNFKIKDISITDAISKNENVIIRFVSTNSQNIPIEYIVINGKQYNVALIEENTYEVVLENIETSLSGKYYLELEKVGLQNLKVFNNKEDYDVNQLAYNVLKTAPSVTNIQLTNEAANKKININYNFHDPDETLKNLSIALIDSTNRIVDGKDINPQDIGKSISLSYQNNNDGRYKVIFYADYNLGTERHDYNDKYIGEEEILTQTEISISNVTLTSVFPEKSQRQYKVTIELNVSDSIKNKWKEFAGATINGLNYDGASDGLKKNTISFTIPQESGLLELRIDRIKLRNESYQGYTQEFFSVAPYTVQIDVLKDKPTIQNLEIVKEDYLKKEVTFKFQVMTDKGGFNEGYIELDGQKQTIQALDNEVTFQNITPDKLFTLNFYGNYDLDTNTLDKENNQNYFENALFYQVSYGLYNEDMYANITLEDAEVISKNNNHYFEKNEDLKIKFTLKGLSDDLDLLVSKVVIDSKEYLLEKIDEQYYLVLEGSNKAGLINISIKEIILNNGKKVTLKEPLNLEAEVLKDPVIIKDFNKELNNKDLTLQFKIQDIDNSVRGKNIADGVKIKIYDENHTLIKEYPYSDTITLTINNDILRYYVEVGANYDRDLKLDNFNYYENKVIFQDVVSIDANMIELKDIMSINLYKEENGRVVALERINVQDLQNNLDKYFVEIIMDKMPTVYSPIKKALDDNHKLVLVLDHEYVTKEKEEVRISCGDIIDGYVTNNASPDTLADLITKIKENPTGTYYLTHNLDATDFTGGENAYLDEVFQGTLIGNGYTIKNLNKPLFNEIRNGKVESLNLENVNLPSKLYHGSLANSINKTTIKDVLVHDVTKNTTEGQSGGLVGSATNNSLIENCRVTNLSIIAGDRQQIGGLIGYTQNSTIQNCYVTGTISANWNFVGGLIGNAINSKISNNITKVTLGGAISCGIACSYGTPSSYDHNVSLSKGAGNKLTNGYNKLEDNYVLTIEDEENNLEDLTFIKEEDVTKDLFIKAQFSEDIWSLKDVSYNNIPTFKIENISHYNTEDFQEEYDSNKETLYQNLSLLMPFYANSKIIESGVNIPANHELNQKHILHIMPIAEDGSLVTYLTKNNPRKIKKIKIVFQDNSTLEYDVVYDKIYDFVVSYRIKDLKIDYTYNHYVLDSESQLVNNLTNYLLSLNYEANLDSLTSGKDSRIYSDFYNEVTKLELKEFVLKFLANSNYTNTYNNEALNDYLEREIKKDEKLEKLLYVYNYFKRFYDVEFDGLKLNDLILFNFQGYSSNLTSLNIANMYLADARNFETNRTSEVYANILSKYTNKANIPEFLEYLVSILTNETSDAWFAQAFKGYLVEINVDNKPQIGYTLWFHIKHYDKNTNVNWYNYALPILTLPENAAYIISSPVQFLIGSQRTYIENPFNATDRAKLIRKIDSYAERMKNYYNTAAGLILDATIFNDINTVQIDKRYAYDENGILTFQNPYSTEEPFHKNFNEVVNSWAYNDYNAATANGAYVIWRVEGLMDGNLITGEGNVQEYTYHTWSHESAHNIDARLFLKNYGRRFNAGGEDYADGNLTQSFNSGDIVMNLSNHYPADSLIAANLNPERINSLNNIADFYKKVFQTIYIMDYLEGKAFLTLSSEEQSKLVVKATYPNENQYDVTSDKPYYTNYLTTVYHTISEEEIKKMELRTIDDLYDNQLVMFPGVIYSTYGANRYGGENIYKVRWYQPHNDYGRPDSYSIKWLAYEMLGYAGYENGYIEYYSNINSIKKTFANVNDKGEYITDDKGNITTSTVDYKTDLMALQKITNDENMTFAKYKHNRFAEVESNLKFIQYLDVNGIYNEFITALKEDAQNVKQTEITALEKYPITDNEEQNKKNEAERNKLIAVARQYPKSTAVRQKVYFLLKNSTVDFTGNVYDKSKPNNFNGFRQLGN